MKTFNFLLYPTKLYWPPAPSFLSLFFLYSISNICPCLLSLITFYSLLPSITFPTPPTLCLRPSHLLLLTPHLLFSLCQFSFPTLLFPISYFLPSFASVPCFPCSHSYSSYPLRRLPYFSNPILSSTSLHTSLLNSSLLLIHLPSAPSIPCFINPHFLRINSVSEPTSLNPLLPLLASIVFTDIITMTCTTQILYSPCFYYPLHTTIICSHTPSPILHNPHINFHPLPVIIVSLSFYFSFLSFPCFPYILPPSFRSPGSPTFTFPITSSSLHYFS